MDRDATSLAQRVLAAGLPCPVSVRRLAELAEAAGLEAPDVVSETTSRYHGVLCAVLRK